MSKYFVLAFTLLTLTCSSLAQDWTHDCSYTFTTGSGQNYLQSCVTVNGNVTEFQSPSGFEDIRYGPWGYSEGYGFCEVSSSTPYFDFADGGDSGNWRAPVLLSSTANSAKIARTTNDGIWTLTQTFTQNAANASLKVDMSLKNNSAVSRTVRLMRWVDANADNNRDNNNLGSDFMSAFAWAGYFGLIMQSVPPWTYLRSGYVQYTPLRPEPCDPFKYVVNYPLINDDGSMFLYYLITIPKASAKHVALTYKAM